MAAASPSTAIRSIARTAGERQAEQPRHLVERLPRRVVQRLRRAASIARCSSSTSSSDECPPETSSADDGVRAAGRAATRRRPRGWRGGSRRTPARPGRRPAPWPSRRRRCSAPTRPGPAVTAMASMSPSAHPRRGAGSLERRLHRLQVRATGDLGHDTAEARVLLDARGDLVRRAGHVPRTIPMPVSSHDVSMPRTTGSSVAVMTVLVVEARGRAA